MAESKSRIIKVTSLWRYESEKSAGGEYFMGNLGDALVLLFHNQSDHPKSPAFDLCVSPPKKRTRRPKRYKAEPSPEPDTEETPSETPEPEWGEDDQFPDEPPDEGEGEDEDQNVPF